MLGRVRYWMVLTLAACVVTGSVAAHDRKTAGRLNLTIGWSDEPAFTGSRNSVIVSFADAKGPINVGTAALTVEVEFGTERTTLPLEPAFARPHEFHAWLVPTRSGTYTFHIKGTINNQPVDVRTTCGETTFHCVVPASDIQFPTKQPSLDEVVELVNRVGPRAQESLVAARRAQWIAIAAFAGAIVAAVIGRRRRQ